MNAPDRLANTLGLLPVGLHVVTAFADEAPAGLLCGWVTQVSWEPPLLVVAVGRSNHTHDVIRTSGAYAVNLLRDDQIEVAQRFGTKSGRDIDKFASLAWHKGPTGSPILEGIAGCLDCRVVDEHRAGDHTLFVAEIVDSESLADECLVYNREQHQRLFEV